MATKRASNRTAESRSLLAQERGQPLAEVLQEFPQGVGSLDWGERFDVLDAWVQVLDGLYAHLPLKRALYGFDPVRAIEHLRPQVPTLTDLQFHRELTTLINRLRDAHTQYTGPKTLKDAVATLPFLVEAFGPVQNPCYLVTKVNRDSVDDPHFEPGVTLEWWNGVPFDRAVDLHAEVETGGRPDARRARALESLTFRALGYSPPPDEQWVIIGYRDHANQAHEIRLDWRVVYPGRAPNASTGLATRTRHAINPAAEAVRRAKKLMFNAVLWQAEQHSRPATRKKGAGATGYEDFLTARPVATRHGKFGYLRIWSFDVDDDQGFLEAAIKLLSKLPDRGLIIDLRDNPGGFIWAAERMLQLFTPNPVAPTRFALRATPLTAAIAAATFNQQELGPWVTSLASAASTGEPYSSHLPITSAEQCSDLGQHYGGPVVVIVDANTYSSGDLFTAGIVDNRIGPVLCIGEATGAGGANVWTSDDVHAAMAAAGHPLPELPDGTSFTLAVRRAVRSGDADGVLIEDSGIAGQPYAMTENDILGSNDDLIEHCAEILAAQPFTRMQVTARRRTLAVTTAGLDQLDVYSDGHPVCATIVLKRNGTEGVRLPDGVREVEVVGFAGRVVRQRRRVQLPRPSHAP
jgi:C-terminal processing protease CtpA/Prc